MRAYNKGIRLVYTINLNVFQTNGGGKGGNPTKYVVTKVVSKAEAGEVRESLEESTEAKAGWVTDSY